MALTPFLFIPRKSSRLTVRAQISINETTHGNSEGLLLLALTEGSFETRGGFAGLCSWPPLDPEPGGAGEGCLLSARPREAGPVGRQEICGQHRPVPRAARRATAHAPARPLWMAPATTMRTHGGDVCPPEPSGHSPGPGAHAAQHRFLAVESWEPARRLLRKRKRRRSTCHSALRVLTWSHGPPLPGLYPRFGMSVRLSGKRIHSLHQVLSSKGPITRRNQAAHNNQPGLVRLGIEGQTE